jgi:hypothetical protein
MATKKRNRRKNTSSASPRSYSQLYKDDSNLPSGAEASGEAENSTAVATSGSRGHDSVDWKSEYAYVVKDLRVLGIVSVVIFALMIGIGMFI